MTWPSNPQTCCRGNSGYWLEKRYGCDWSGSCLAIPPSLLQRKSDGAGVTNAAASLRKKAALCLDESDEGSSVLRPNCERLAGIS